MHFLCIVYALSIVCYVFDAVYHEGGCMIGNKPLFIVVCCNMHVLCICYVTQYDLWFCFGKCHWGFLLLLLMEFM